jgi:hypothetical protein
MVHSPGRAFLEEGRGNAQGILRFLHMLSLHGIQELLDLGLDHASHDTISGSAALALPHAFQGGWMIGHNGLLSSCKPTNKYF